MAFRAPACTVFISKPLHMSYGDAIGRLHVWLDDKKIHPAGFKITADGPIGFELNFAGERDAGEFELFSWLTA
jgi:hypothetical protein